MRIAFVTLLAVAAGCGGKPVPANTRGCYGAGCAVVATSHYNPDFTGTGTLHTVKLTDGKVTPNIDSTLDPDTAITILDDKLWILNRTSGALRRYDMVTLTAELEISTGNAEAPNTLSSPSDFYVTSDGAKIYVSLLANNGAHALGVLDPKMPNAGVIKFIEIPALATDADGSPEASDLYFCKDKLYVALKDYTFMGREIVYSDKGRLAIVDTKTDTTVGTIALDGQNPSELAAEGDDCTKALVATSSNLTTVPDGKAGLERVDLSAGKSLGMLFKDTDIEGRPFSIEVVSSTLAYAAVYFDPQMGQDGKLYLGSAKVLALNPSTGKKIGDASGKAGFINFARVSPDKHLVVGVGAFAGMAEPGKLAEGLYVGPADGTLLSSTAISLGQTPSAIAFHQ